jgi:hypothetical protein
MAFSSIPWLVSLSRRPGHISLVVDFHEVVLHIAGQKAVVCIDGRDDGGPMLCEGRAEESNRDQIQKSVWQRKAKGLGEALIHLTVQSQNTAEIWFGSAP